MGDHIGETSNAWRKLLLATAGAMALCVPAVLGGLAVPSLRAGSMGTRSLQQAPGESAAPSPPISASSGTRSRPTFDAISVKPSNSTDPRGALQFQPGGRLVAINIPLRPVFALAYNLSESQGHNIVIGAPSWFDSKHYNIEAKADGDPPREQMLLMLQSLFADRFKLIVHHEKRQLPVYALVVTKVGKMGPQLKRHSNDAECINEPQTDPGPGKALQAYCGDYRIAAAEGGGLRETADAITMDRFAASLAQQVDRPVVDRTGLSGIFDLDLQWLPLDTQAGSDATASGSPAQPVIFTAIHEQLGLKFEPTRGPVDVLVIDHVEEPAPN